MRANELQLNLQNQTSNDIELFKKYQDYFDKSPISTFSKLQNFSKYVRRQDISRFLAKNELIKLQLDIPGSIVECGCFQGGGTLTFAQLSSIYEPFNHTRKIIAFDTFEGFPGVSEKDTNEKKNYDIGDLLVYQGIESEIQIAADLLDTNRPIAHIPKIELVKGDAMIEMPAYVENNPHLVISLMYLDFDIYEPTLKALEFFYPRMPKGAVLAFDELNAKVFPGETLAVMKHIGLNKLKLKKTIFDPYISYAIID